MRIMRSIRRTTALAVCAVAGITALLIAAPAQAQSTTPHATAAAPVAVSAHGTFAAETAVIPGVVAHSPCDVVFWRNVSSTLCFQGTYLDGGRPYRWPVTELDLRAFSNRVWLHQNENGSGWADCFTGGGDYLVFGRDQTPGNIFVSANTAPC